VGRKGAKGVVMLTKEVARGFSPAPNYPTYKYVSRSGKGYRARCDRGRITPTPKGYREVIDCPDIDTDFAEYLKWIEDDHKDVSDNEMRENPHGIYLGAWRNARWEDEAKRRGLI